MDELEIVLEELVEEVRRKDTIAAVLVSTALFLFGVLTLILLDVLRVDPVIKSVVVVGILIATWFTMSLGIYMLVSTPIPKLPVRIVADVSGIDALMKKRYANKIYVSPETYKKIPPAVSLRMNIEIIDPPEEMVERYRSYGDELANALGAAKVVKAKYVVSEAGNMKVDGVQVIKPENFGTQ
jgi:hypothetical protein